LDALCPNEVNLKSTSKRIELGTRSARRDRLYKEFLDDFPEEVIRDSVCVLPSHATLRN
jgi:hypothetical protein